MNMTACVTPNAPALLNRADGNLRLSTKAAGVKTAGIDRLYQSGAMKAVFPRGDRLTCVMVNTAGGITGGDRFAVDIDAAAPVDITTQAAERAYRARDGETGRVRTHLRVRSGARLHWLPQETILFDGCNLDRHLRVEAEADSELLLVEPLIFGRAAMGERRVHGQMRDRIEVFQNGRPIYMDARRLSGDLSDQMSRAGIGADATAMATLVLLSPKAESLIEPLRDMLPRLGGVSLRSEDLLCLRLLAQDGYALRRDLLPILDLLTQNTLPTCWRL